MINPYYIHVISFVLVLFAYLFRWSDLYPELSLSLIIFLLCTIIIALIIGTAFVKDKVIVFENLSYKNNMQLITILILAGYGLEFLYAGNFPLLSIFGGPAVPYHEFGIPTFHVLLVTFNSFYAVYLFQLCLTEKLAQRKKVIILFILTLVPSVLIMNRGMLVMIMMSCVFIYLIKFQYKITFKKIAGLAVFLLFALYLFGVLGNMRLNSMYQTNTSLNDNELFLDIGGATEEFRQSFIPKEFFWTYIYLTSPLANLQKTINEFEFTEDVNIDSSFDFTVTQLFPDFISKRIVAIFNITSPNPIQITPELNVSTAFAQAYTILGWVGMSFFILFLFVLAFFYILSLKKIKSPYFIVGVAIMNSIFLFNLFSNMFAFTGLSFQLIYPLLFSLFTTKIKVNEQAG